METNYLLILDYASGIMNIIHLTAEEIKESEKYDDFSDFLHTLEDKYEFRLKDCEWMTVDSLQIYRYENGKEVSNA